MNGLASYSASVQQQLSALCLPVIHQLSMRNLSESQQQLYFASASVQQQLSVRNLSESQQQLYFASASVSAVAFGAVSDCVSADASAPTLVSK